MQSMPGMMPSQPGGFAPLPNPQRPPQQRQMPEPPPLQPPKPVAAQPPVKPKILGQSPDESDRPGPPPVPPPPAPVPVAMAKVALPSPEELGITAPRPGTRAFDWNTVEPRLHSLRAVGFQMTQTQQGGWKAVCVLPTAQADKVHRIEKEADTRAEAVRQALELAEMWAAGK